MVASIAVLFEFASGLTGQQLVSKPPDDHYWESVYQTRDKRFLKLVQSMDVTWGSGSQLCMKIRTELDENTDYQDLKIYQSEIPVVTVHPRLIGACDLNSDGHRVLIAPSPVGSVHSHSLYSCLLRQSLTCSFESSRG